MGEAFAQKYPERRIAREGNRLFEAGDFEAAGTKYTEALELEGDFPEAQFNLGNTMLAGEKLDEAIELYKSVLRRDPGDDEARYNLAYAQKLKQEQEDQSQDQNDQSQGGDQSQDQPQGGDGQQEPQQGDGEQQQDQQGGGDGDQQQEQQSDDEGERPQGGDQPQNGDGQNDPQQGDGNQPQQGDGQQDPSQNQPQGQGGMSRQDAENMLEAMQAQEDNTREKVDGQKVPAGSRSGKDW